MSKLLHHLTTNITRISSDKRVSFTLIKFCLMVDQQILWLELTAAILKPSVLTSSQPWLRWEILIPSLDPRVKLGRYVASEIKLEWSLIDDHFYLLINFHKFDEISNFFFIWFAAKVRLDWLFVWDIEWKTWNVFASVKYY